MIGAKIQLVGGPCTANVEIAADHYIIELPTVAKTTLESPRLLPGDVCAVRRDSKVVFRSEVAHDLAS